MLFSTAFAGESTIYCLLHDSAYDFYTLQRDLNRFAKWTKLWQLNVSHGRCHVLHTKFQSENFLKLGKEVLSTTNGIDDLAQP